MLLPDSSLSLLRLRLPDLRRYFFRWINRRIPPSKKITLTQRSIFIFPSKIGFSFLTLLAILLVGAINYQNALIFACTFLLGSMFIVSILHTYKNLSQLSLEFVQSKNGFAGEALEFSIMISRPLDSPRESIQIGRPQEDMQWIDLSEVSSVTQKLYFTSTKRGWFRPGRLLIMTHYPVGLLRAWTWVDLDTRAIAYPVPLFHARAQQLTQEHENGLQRPHGNDDFYSIRPYQAGDPVRQISWRQYARSDELFIKQFSTYEQEQLILDWHQLSGDMEYRISRLTGMALQAFERKLEFSLRLPGEILPADSGQEHLEKALRVLSLYGSSDKTKE